MPLLLTKVGYATALHLQISLSMLKILSCYQDDEKYHFDFHLLRTIQTWQPFKPAAYVKLNKNETEKNGNKNVC